MLSLNDRMRLDKSEKVCWLPLSVLRIAIEVFSCEMDKDVF